MVRIFAVVCCPSHMGIVVRVTIEALFSDVDACPGHGIPRSSMRP